MLTKIIPLILACFVIAGLNHTTFAQRRTTRPIPSATLLLITKAEDQRRWDNDLRNLFSDANAAVRKRAALAAGRISNEDSINALTTLLEQDKDAGVRSIAAFALGEVESVTGANALLAVLKNTSASADLR